MTSVPLVYGLVLILFVACSGSNSGSDYAEAKQAYEESLGTRTDAVAGSIAAVYVERLASQPAGADFFKQFEEPIAGLTDFLCDQIKDLRAKAGSGETKAKRLDDVRVGSEDLVQDRFVRALLGTILTAPPGQGEQLLNALGVNATGTDGTELHGTAALKQVGLFDSQGQVPIPKRGTDEHVRYERWLYGQGAAFGGTVSRLMGDARAEIERCSSSA
jgi:hypothetical protein